MKLREDGGYSLPLSVCIDGMSLLIAVQNVVAKIPTEASTLHHVQWLQQLLRRRVLHALYWVDTRDMIADGMTKGSVPRQALRTLQEKGAWRLLHEWRKYPEREVDARREAQASGTELLSQGAVTAGSRCSK